MSKPTLIVNYGPDAQYRVEFRLNTAGQVEGRYLPANDGFGRQTEWEVRHRDFDDPDHVAVIDHIEDLLTAYAG